MFDPDPFRIHLQIKQIGQYCHSGRKLSITVLHITEHMQISVVSLLKCKPRRKKKIKLTKIKATKTTEEKRISIFRFITVVL